MKIKGRKPKSKTEFVCIWLICMLITWCSNDWCAIEATWSQLILKNDEKTRKIDLCHKKFLFSEQKKKALKGQRRKRFFFSSYEETVDSYLKMCFIHPEYGE